MQQRRGQLLFAGHRRGRAGIVVLLAVMLVVIGAPAPMTASTSGYWVSASFPAAGTSRFEPSLAVSPSGTTLYVSHSVIGSPGNVTVHDASTGAVHETIPGAMGTRGVVLSADGSRLYVANSGQTGRPRNPGTASTIQVVETRTNTVTASIETDRGVSHLVLSPDGGTLYAPAYQGNSVTFIDTASNAITAKVALPGYPGRAAVSPDGKTLYIADEASPSIFVVSVEERRVVETFGTGLGTFCSSLWSLALNPSGTELYMTGCAVPESVNPDAVVILDTVTRSRQAVPLAGHAIGIAFSPDASTAFVSVNGAYGHIAAINTATKSVSATFPAGQLPAGRCHQPRRIHPLHRPRGFGRLAGCPYGRRAPGLYRRSRKCPVLPRNQLAFEFGDQHRIPGRLLPAPGQHSTRRDGRLPVSEGRFPGLVCSARRLTIQGPWSRGHVLQGDHVAGRPGHHHRIRGRHLPTQDAGFARSHGRIPQPVCHFREPGARLHCAGYGAVQ